jgi:adenylate cyclase
MFTLLVQLMLPAAVAVEQPPALTGIYEYLNLSALCRYFYSNILDIFDCVQSKLNCERGYCIQKKKESLHAPVAT